jgi:hypothetical protein
MTVTAIFAPAPAGAASIPTLSSGGFLLLTLLLAVAGSVALGFRKGIGS